MSLVLIHFEKQSLVMHGVTRLLHPGPISVGPEEFEDVGRKLDLTFFSGDSAISLDSDIETVALTADAQLVRMGYQITLSYLDARTQYD